MNKRFKLLALLALTGVFVLGVSAGVLAIGHPQLSINGKAVSSDLEPTLVKGRLMVPLRAVAESLGAKVTWDNKEKTADISTENKIWNDAPDPWHALDAYNGVIAVSRYLSLLQGAVCDADLLLRENLANLFSQAVLDSPEPWTKVWYPANITVGSSVRRLNFEILDARVVPAANGAFGHYEVAAKIKYYDPLAGEPAYRESVRVYTVIQENYTKVTKDGLSQNVSHYVIDSEKTLKEIKLDSSQMAGFYN